MSERKVNMLTKIKTIIGVMIMMAASVSVAEQPVLDRVNTLLKEGMSQAVNKLSADRQFLPFLFMVGKEGGVNRRADSSNKEAFTSEDVYKAEINKVMNIAVAAANQNTIVGALVFGQTTLNIKEIKYEAITVFIEAKDIKPRQLIYAYKYENEKLKLFNPIETTYDALMIK